MAFACRQFCSAGFSVGWVAFFALLAGGFLKLPKCFLFENILRKKENVPNFARKIIELNYSILKNHAAMWHFVQKERFITKKSGKISLNSSDVFQKGHFVFKKKTKC